MSLMFPSGLWLLCVAAGIAVIYFLRMPRRKVVVADLAPWLHVARAGKRMSSERRTMISLVLQLAIALALLFAFARPFFTGPQGGRLELVLVNLSASTRARDDTPLKVLEGLEKPAPAGPSRLDIEKRALQSMIRAMNPGDRMTLIGVGARTTIISSGESETAVLERSVSALEARNESAAFASACQLAVELAKSEKNVRVTVIDDGSTESADFAALNKLPEAAGKIRCVKVGKSAENVGIVGFKSRKKFNSDEIETTVAIFNSAAQPLKIPVELYLDGKVQRATIAEIAAGATEVVNFSIDYRRGGTLKARLAVQDAIQEDNEAVDFLPVPHRMKVALVTREPMDEKAANDYYLARVLRSDTGVEGGFLAAADYQKIAQDKTALKSQFEAVVFDNWAPPAGELPPCHALFVNAETSEIPVAVKGVLGDKPLIRKWDEGHPLMNYLNLRDVFLRRAKDLQSNDKTSDVVAELVSSPLILAREIGRRKVAYIGFNPSDSDIQFKKELPLFVLNAFEWFKRGVEPVTQIAPGEAMSIPTDSAWKSVTVQPPDDAARQKLDIPPGAENVMFFQTLRPGIYRYKADAEKASAGGFAVNFGSEHASKVSATDAIRIGTLDERGGISTNRADATTLDALVEHHASAGLWVYFAAFAFVLMAAENYLFHRRIFFQDDRMAGIRFEALAPQYGLLLLLLPVVLYHALKTEAAAGRGRKITVAVLRALGIVLIATALVRVRAWRWADETRLCTLAIVDVSESMPRDKMSDVAKEIAELSKAASDERQFGMLIFAGRCFVSIPPAAKPITEQAAQSIIQSAFDAKPGTQAFAELERNETRFDAAFELAASTFPAGSGKRIVLWSDGNETDGSALALAANLRKSGIDINARIVPATRANSAGERPLDVLVAALNLPTQVRIQEAFDAKVELMSTREAAGKIVLYRNGFLAGSKEVTLSQGATEVTFRQSITESGQYVYRAVFETKETQPRENDEAFAYLTAVGAPHILVIGTHELESSRLIEALRSRKSFIEYRDAYGAPQTLLELFGFDAVVINNVPAASLSENQMRVLRDYVRDFGGGAVVIGGQHSLTAGQYAGTPLDDILPVSCLQEGLTRPSSSVVLVVDTSRSMLTQKLPNGQDFDAPAFVRTVAQAISDRLAPNDFLGIIGTGNERTAPRWLVRMQKVYDRDHIRDDIQREFAGPAAFDKGSNVYQSMRRAAEELSQQDTRLKQIVVLSDGYFDSGYSYPRLAAKLNSDHYRISTIPGGPDSDTKVLEDMARWGGGQFLKSDSSGAPLDAIKSLFGEAETGVVVEDPFRPRKIAESPLIENVEINTAPTLFGYVRTKLKIGATNILAVPPEYDPLLASWDCGEGRAAVFTSDVRDKWGVLWVREWGRNFDTFWNGVIMSVARRSQTTKLVPHLSVSGQSVRASVDLLDLKERFISGKKVHCELYSLGEQGLLYTRSNMDRFELNADGPGKYSATHRIRSKGLYAVKFRGPEHGQIVSTGIVVSNFREYLTLAPDTKFLQELCEAGGGTLDAETAVLTSLAGKRRETLTDVGHWALLAACILFLGDVAARRWPAILRALRRNPS